MLTQHPWVVFAIVLAIAVPLAVMGAVGMWALRHIGSSAFSSGAAPDSTASFSQFFLQSARIATVFLIVMATVILAMMERLDKGAIGILSGVAGYVLGGVQSSKRQSPEKQPDATKPTPTVPPAPADNSGNAATH